MSESNENNYGFGRSPSRTERVEEQRLEREANMSQRQPQTQRQLHYDSPTKYDIDFYQRKVNRLQNDVAALQDQLSIARFRLHKAQDFQIKYELLFKQNQNINVEFDHLSQQNLQRKKENQDLRDKLAKCQLETKNQRAQIENEKQLVEQLRKKKDQMKSKVSNEGAQQKASVEDTFLRQIDNLKKENRDREQKLKGQLLAAKTLIQTKEATEASNSYKLDKIKQDKDAQIIRLKELISAVKTQLTETKKSGDNRITEYRRSLIEETDSRVEHIRNLTSAIELSLMTEIRNLNDAIKNKDTEIAYLLECDKKFMEDNENIQNGLKQHIKRLQQKIFVIQRETEIELFKTIDRLKKQYDQNVENMNTDFDRIKEGHQQKVRDLQENIANLKKENKLLDSENKKIEDQHKKVSQDKELAIAMFSQKIISLESMKDLDLKNYTTSMKHIQEDAKAKLQDLHSAIENKNTEFEIMNAQLSLKNQEITHLLNQLNSLRSSNRQKMRKLQATNAMEQNSLNDMISSYKKEILELKQRIHQIQSEMADKTAENELRLQLMRQELNLQKQSNAKLRARNDFLVEWSKELENDLKKERIGNVDILHDHSVSRRETVQMREKVRVQLEAIKDKEVEQIRNIFKLQKGRLQSDLNAKEHELRDKKAELSRLLVEYKNLEKKVGKTSKLDKGSEENGKCRATLEAEILLTENIFNAINKP